MGHITLSILIATMIVMTPLASGRTGQSLSPLEKEAAATTRMKDREAANKRLKELIDAHPGNTKFAAYCLSKMLHSDQRQKPSLCRSQNLEQPQHCQGIAGCLAAETAAMDLWDWYVVGPA